MIEPKRVYGDEELGYQVLAKDMTPEDVRRYIDENFNDALIERMPHGRLLALIRRAKEED